MFLLQLGKRRGYTVSSFFELQQQKSKQRNFVFRFWSPTDETKKKGEYDDNFSILIINFSKTECI